ncbi:hypothetical protein C8J57DRAFT_1238193 [Mycena rebaudengoi]|nr:hypothetical protein C8J57DRAFT_1238193 [Mycena rebaudengoi]
MTGKSATLEVAELVPDLVPDEGGLSFPRRSGFEAPQVWEYLSRMGHDNLVQSSPNYLQCTACIFPCGSLFSMCTELVWQRPNTVQPAEVFEALERNNDLLRIAEEMGEAGNDVVKFRGNGNRGGSTENKSAEIRFDETFQGSVFERPCAKISWAREVERLEVRETPKASRKNSNVVRVGNSDIVHQPKGVRFDDVAVKSGNKESALDPACDRQADLWGGRVEALVQSRLSSGDGIHLDPGACFLRRRLSTQIVTGTGTRVADGSWT